jgi:anti-repressor protein
MAKELAMVERNAKGKEARQYFIAIEKAYREHQPRLPQTFAEALQLAADQARQIEEQTKQITVMQPKAKYYDQLLGSDEVFDGEKAAKTLRTSRKALFAFLRQRGVLTDKNLPMQYYIDKDYIRTHPTPYEDMFGNVRVSFKPVFTHTGLQYIQILMRQLEIQVNKAISVSA